MTAKKPKHATKMTSDEIAKRVFPTEVHEQLKKAANPDPNPSQKNSQEKRK